MNMDNTEDSDKASNRNMMIHSLCCVMIAYTTVSSLVEYLKETCEDNESLLELNTYKNNLMSQHSMLMKYMKGRKMFNADSCDQFVKHTLGVLSTSPAEPEKDVLVIEERLRTLYKDVVNG